MSKENHSSSALQGFEPSAVRLKRKLRLILNKNLRRDQISEENVTLGGFMFYSVYFLLVTTICIINHLSQDTFNADRCIRRLLINKLELDAVTKPHEFWEYLYRFNEELYSNVAQWKVSANNSKQDYNYQMLLSNENFILGVPRLRQIRIDDTHCEIIKDLSVRPIQCYAIYHKSKEYRGKLTTMTGTQYEYTSSKTTDALKLSNAYGPYDTGGYIYHFHSKKDLNDKAIDNLKTATWLDLNTRAIFIEFIYFNPNTELLTTINILFEFLTTGTIHVRDFFYTVPVNSFFFGRKKFLGLFQVLFILCNVAFAFYYVGKIAQHRLRFIMSSYWNVYDLGLLTLFTISFYLDINFLVYIAETYKCFSISKNDIFNELIHFIEIQINRIYLEACITAAVLIRLLRYLPHFSNLIANLLKAFYKSLRNSLGFLFLFFLIFMSFVISATFHYGDELYEFHTFALTSYTLIRCTLGQFEYDRAYRVSPTWTPIFYMVYVCVVFFILLNLLVAVVNEAYVLGKLEQKQIEDDIQEEYIHGSNNERLNALHRSKRPILQAALIQKMKRFLHIFSTQSINRNDSIDLRTDIHDNDDISLDAKQTIIVEKLQNVLLDDGYNKNVIEKFVQRLSANNDYEDEIFLFEIEESQTIKILYDEFKIFNNQHEKLAQDWQKTAMAAREMIQINTVDLEQALTMGQHLDILDQRLKKIENLIPKALENIIELYVNHFSTD
ncbi:unnamed protein product [Rotaria socialis]|uniref:Uncharacterized protein n=1 Tax=Rotaria socialis TaxID=392032 RepID=A0A821SFJ1_9BILA|nr:unnamed protein product [Rotaria socialis]CAF4857615.1 unnamed protein product [Rotaria socialis]